MGVKEVLDAAQDVKQAVKDPVETAKKAIKAKMMPYVGIGIGIFVGVIVIVGIIAGIVSAVAAEDEERQTRNMEGYYAGANWEKFLRYVEINEGGSKTADGLYYYVEDDSEHNPTIGHGLCLKSGSSYLHVDEFAAYGVDSKDLADKWLENPSRKYLTVSVEICDKIWSEHLKGLFDSVSTTYSSLGLTEYQYMALADVLYRRGDTSSEYGSFTSLYNSLWNSTEDKYKEDPSSETYSMSSLYKFFNNNRPNDSGVYKRKKRQWVLFKYGWFDYQDGTGEYWEESAGGGYFDGDTYTDSFGRTFKLYKQNDPEWENVAYPGYRGTIGANGCCPTSMSIICSGWGLDEVNPVSLCTSGRSYTGSDAVRALFAEKGFNYQEIYPYNTSRVSLSSKEAQIKEALLAGKKIIVRAYNGNFSGSYYSGGHFFTILGYNSSNNMYFFGDPIMYWGGEMSLSAYTATADYIGVVWK